MADYLVPTDLGGNLEDDAFEDFLHDWLAGISGLAEDMVRPAFQANPSPFPDSGNTWMAFTFRRSKGDWDPVVRGTSIFRMEEIRILCGFYGPASGARVMQFRMSTGINQNIWPLHEQRMAFVSVDEGIIVSEKIKGKFQRRMDVEVVLRRAVQFSYAVPELASATGQILSDAPPVPIEVSLRGFGGGGFGITRYGD
jgi:hypothetical protein